jgi:hypothetical protein
MKKPSLTLLLHHRRTYLIYPKGLWVAETIAERRLLNDDVGCCLVDTCSDVTVARRDVVTIVHFVRQPILVGHMGAETIFGEAGTLELRSSSGMSSTFLSDVHVVEPNMLPAGVVALLGVADIRALNLSLDAITADPDCPWDRLFAAHGLAE